VHGWVYSLFDGRVRQLGIDVGASEELVPAYQKAIAAVQPQGNRHE
jgi:carbonic anhydrase